MAVDRTPVLKRCRSLGLEPAYLGIDKKSKRQLKNNRRKVSEYGAQLREKQKVKYAYGILERQFRNTYARAARMKGQKGENLLFLLESRLDNLVYRMGFARTRKAARQLVTHGHIEVDGKKLDIPSAQILPGQVVAVRENARNMTVINDALNSNYTAPAFVTVDKDNKKGTYVRIPERSELNQEINESLIVEYYNR